MSLHEAVVELATLFHSGRDVASATATAVLHATAARVAMDREERRVRHRHRGRPADTLQITTHRRVKREFLDAVPAEQEADSSRTEITLSSKKKQRTADSNDSTARAVAARTGAW